MVWNPRYARQSRKFPTRTLLIQQLDISVLEAYSIQNLGKAVVHSFFQHQFSDEVSHLWKKTQEDMAKIPSKYMPCIANTVNNNTLNTVYLSLQTFTKYSNCSEDLIQKFAWRIDNFQLRHLSRCTRATLCIKTITITDLTKNKFILNYSALPRQKCFILMVIQIKKAQSFYIQNLKHVYMAVIILRIEPDLFCHAILGN